MELVFEDRELGFNEQAISPGFDSVLAFKEFKRPIIFGTAVSPHQRAIAAMVKYFFKIDAYANFFDVNRRSGKRIRRRNAEIIVEANVMSVHGASN